MSVFKTSRVVVIDDLPDEALPVIEALGRLGIGCIYIRGERLEDLPKERPLRGIRLVILDMRLGTTGGDKQTASMTANVFHKMISPDDGPLIVLLWTKHNEDVPAFQEALFNLEPRFRSTLLIADLEKPAKISAATMRKIIQKVQSLAKQWTPMGFLWNWEQIAHASATSTTAMIANHVSANAAIEHTDADEQRKAKWLTALRLLLQKLAQAAGGSGTGPHTAQEDLLEALIAIQSDRIEIEAALARTEDLRSIFEEGGAGTTKDQAAEINGMLLLGAAATKPQEVRPGNAYILHRSPSKRGPFEPCGIDIKRLAKEILGHFESDSEFKTLIAAKSKVKDEPEKLALAEKACNKRKAALISQCLPIVVEITPSCDYAQRTRHVVRLAAGLLVPGAMEKVVFGRKDSLRTLELVKVPGLDGVWKPVFSGRFLFTLVDPQKCLTMIPAFRLRAQVLSDLRNWYSSQAARPGYLSICA